MGDGKKGFAMASECCCEDDSDVDGGAVDEDDGYMI